MAWNFMPSFRNAASYDLPWNYLDLKLSLWKVILGRWKYIWFCYVLLIQLQHLKVVLRTWNTSMDFWQVEKWSPVTVYQCGYFETAGGRIATSRSHPWVSTCIRAQYQQWFKKCLESKQSCRFLRSRFHCQCGLLRLLTVWVTSCHCSCFFWILFHLTVLF